MTSLIRRSARGSSCDSSSSATRRRLDRIDRRAASVGCAVNTGRTASRCDERGHLLRRQSGRPDPLGRLRQPAALPGPLHAHLAGPVHLLGDVGEVEVGAEGPHQPGGRVEVDLFEKVGELAPTVRAGAPVAALTAAQPTDPLDQLEQLGTLLAHQRLAEQVPQPAHVGSQRRLVVQRRGVSFVMNADTGSVDRAEPAAEVANAR